MGKINKDADQRAAPKSKSEGRGLRSVPDEGVTELSMPYPKLGDWRSFASRLIRDRYTEDQWPTLRQNDDKWFRYHEGAWVEVSERWLDHDISEHLSGVVLEGGKEPLSFPETRHNVSEVRAAVGRQTHYSGMRVEPPYLFEADGTLTRQPGIQIVNNGILELDADSLGTKLPARLKPHTPQVFGTTKLPVDYDPNAKCPKWQAWLANVFKHDPLAIETLQQWFGYLLSGDTSLQKFLLVVGEPGTGKSTINRIVEALFGGSPAVGSTSLKRLDNEFGLGDVYGSQVVICADEHANSVEGDARSNLFKIVGEDALPVNIKGVQAFRAVISSRVIVTANSMPPFNDKTAAVVRRALIITTGETFGSGQDSSVERELHGELAGILTWALRGLIKLRKKGQFTEPATMAEQLLLLRKQGSSFVAFLDEGPLEITGNRDDVASFDEVYEDYEVYYREVHNSRLIGIASKNAIEKELAAGAVDGVKNGQARTGQHNPVTTSKRKITKNRNSEDQKKKPRLLRGVRYRK